MEHKKVELAELFFDLVLVYAISKTTGLIHHLHEGAVDPIAMVSFVVSYIIIVNAWMYQVIFTNRFGSNSLRDILFSLVNMALLLFLSNTITDEWEATFVPFSVTLGFIFLVQMVQYVLAYTQEKGEDSRFLIRGFLVLTGIYAGVLFIGSALPYGIGVFVTLAGLITNVLLPLRFMRRLNRIPLNFPHLVERLTLLVIITFGEMIVGIATWFTVDTLSVASALVFGICASLFIHYVWIFDRMIDLHTSGQGASRLQYAHLPIFLGLGMITVSFSFLTYPEAALRYVVGFMYVGLLLFYLGIHWSRTYLADQYRPTRAFSAVQLAVFAVSFLACFFLANSTFAVIVITFLCTFAEGCTLAWNYMHANRLAQERGGRGMA